MGTYIEEIPFSYGHEEARRRISMWRETEGKDFELKEKGENWILIKRKTLHFIITFLPDVVKIEGWVGGITKYSLSPKAFVGAIARRRGWSVFETLREAITDHSTSMGIS